MKVALLTAIYDGYDTLKPLLAQDGVHVEAYCVTDSEPLARGDHDPGGWEIVYEPEPDLHPNRAAKAPKMRPWMYADGVEVSVWLDASFHVVSPRFLAEVAALASEEWPLWQFPHPWRNCLYAEAAESARLAKYAGEPVLRQAEHYRAQGMPADWGLWATGLIVRRHDSDAVQRQGLAWEHEIQDWSFQDQISHPYACWRTGARPAPLPGDHFHNPWVAYDGSGRH